jgi:hypothetical protein
MKSKLLQLFVCLSLLVLTSGASAVEIIIHDIEGDYEYGPGLVKNKAECLYVIEAEDGIRNGTIGQFGVIGDGNCHLWLYDCASITVTCTEPTDVIYAQSSGSDSDDGFADYYVDDVLVASVQTWMRGVWYIEIKGFPETAHTVKVVARDGVVNIDYFGLGDVPVPVDFDIKPGSCPNPFNVGSQGVLPVAILGSENLDINSIDMTTIRLEGIAPIRSSFEDVAAPADAQNPCDCTTQGADGFTDLTLKFDTQEIVNAIGEVVDGEMLQLVITGKLTDGTKIEGSDCIRIIKKNGKK